jgi:hypothetical protein
VRDGSRDGKRWVGFAIDFAEHPWPSVSISCSLKRKVLVKRSVKKEARKLLSRENIKKTPLKYFR